MVIADKPTSMKFDHYIFDLDGTLVNTKEIHTQVFNDTLRHFGYTMIPSGDLHRFEGLPSSKKINLYNEIYMGPTAIAEEVFLKEKQRRSLKALSDYDFYDNEIFSILKTLSRHKEVSIATNCTLESVMIILQSMRISFFVDNIAHNLSGKPKPEPDLYNACIERSKVSEKNTVAFEDNEKGIEAATKASSEICIIRVNGPEQLKKLFL